MTAGEFVTVREATRFTGSRGVTAIAVILVLAAGPALFGHAGRNRWEMLEQVLADYLLEKN